MDKKGVQVRLFANLIGLSFPILHYSGSVVYNGSLDGCWNLKPFTDVGIKILSLR